MPNFELLIMYIFDSHLDVPHKGNLKLLSSCWRTQMEYNLVVNDTPMECKLLVGDTEMECNLIVGDIMIECNFHPGQMQNCIRLKFSYIEHLQQ